MLKKRGVLVLIGLCVSCTYFQKKVEEDPVARVGDHYLYKEDLEALWSTPISEEDSAIIVNNFINIWAKKHLLVEKAKINLKDEKIAEFEKLVEEYRKDLFAVAYKEALVSREMDTVIPLDEMTSFYEDHKENFKLKEDLLKLRYIQIDKNFSNLDLIKERLARFNRDDKIELEALSLQFKAHTFNDSTWVKANEFIQKIPLINSNNRNRYLKKSQFFELTDSLEVYLVQIEDILKRNENAPLEYITPTLQQIILNKRKLEFIRNLERDLIDEAIQKKQFQIYEKN